MSGKKPVLTKTPVWQALAVLGWARDIFLAEVLPPGAKDIKACELHCKVRCEPACRIAGLGSERLAEFGNFFWVLSFSLSLSSLFLLLAPQKGVDLGKWQRNQVAYLHGTEPRPDLCEYVKKAAKNLKVREMYFSRPRIEAPLSPRDR